MRPIGKRASTLACRASRSGWRPGPHLPLPPNALSAWAAVCALAAIFPDIDHRGSTIARLACPVRALWVVVHRLWELADEDTADAWMGARGRLAHSIPGALFLGGLVAGVCHIRGWPLWIGAAVVAGCVTHDLGDCLTKRPVPLFGGKTRFALGLFRTGGTVEHGLVTPALGALIAWLATQTL